MGVRSLPAIFTATLLAFIVAATALMTNQFGMRDWPTAPAPQISTRVVTPADDVVVDRAPTEHARTGGTGRERAEARRDARTAAPVRRPRADRGARTRRPPQTQVADNDPLPSRQAPSEAPDPGAPQPADPAADPVAQAREDAVVPAVPEVAPPPLAVPPKPVGDEDDDEERRGLVHHLLDQLP
jgi:hypothetical protein